MRSIRRWILNGSKHARRLNLCHRIPLQQPETPSAARARAVQQGGPDKDDGEVKSEADGQEKMRSICRLVPCVCRWLRATAEQLRNSKVSAKLSPSPCPVSRLHHAANPVDCSRLPHGQIILDPKPSSLARPSHFHVPPAGTDRMAATKGPQLDDDGCDV